MIQMYIPERVNVMRAIIVNGNQLCIRVLLSKNVFQNDLLRVTSEKKTDDLKTIVK